MKTERCISSTNGRWGVKILMDESFLRSSIIPGDINPLGRVNGFDCFEIVDDNRFIILGSVLLPIANCVAVVSVGLQSNNNITVLRANPGALWKWYGYKGRSSGFTMLDSEGETHEACDAVLLAAGVIEPKKAPEPVPEIPTVSNNLQAALVKAGLVKI